MPAEYKARAEQIYPYNNGFQALTGAVFHGGTPVRD
jgi:hypothetical protein